MKCLAIGKRLENWTKCLMGPWGRWFLACILIQRTSLSAFPPPSAYLPLSEEFRKITRTISGFSLGRSYPWAPGENLDFTETPRLKRAVGTLVPGVHSHSPDYPLSPSSPICFSSIIRKMPKDYKNYFRLSVRKIVFMGVRRKPGYPEDAEHR